MIKSRIICLCIIELIVAQNRSKAQVLGFFEGFDLFDNLVFYQSFIGQDIKIFEGRMKLCNKAVH